MRVVLIVVGSLLCVGLVASYVLLGTRSRAGKAPNGSTGEASQSTVEANGRSLRFAIQQWQALHHQSTCPTIEQLVSEKRLDSSWPTPDPWGQSYRTLCAAGEVTVSSAGPDRRFDTADDISVPRAVR